MPTIKQTRESYAKLVRARRIFQRALNEAHHHEVIEYPAGTFRENAPCAAFDECWARVIKTTEKQLASAMREELGEFK